MRRQPLPNTGLQSVQGLVPSNPNTLVLARTLPSARAESEDERSPLNPRFTQLQQRAHRQEDSNSPVSVLLPAQTSIWTSLTECCCGPNSSVRDERGPATARTCAPVQKPHPMVPPQQEVGGMLSATVEAAGDTALLAGVLASETWLARVASREDLLEPLLARADSSEGRGALAGSTEGGTEGGNAAAAETDTPVQLAGMACMTKPDRLGGEYAMRCYGSEEEDVSTDDEPAELETRKAGTERGVQNSVGAAESSLALLPQLPFWDVPEVDLHGAADPFQGEVQLMGGAVNELENSEEEGADDVAEEEQKVDGEEWVDTQGVDGEAEEDEEDGEVAEQQADPITDAAGEPRMAVRREMQQPDPDPTIPGDGYTRPPTWHYRGTRAKKRAARARAEELLGLHQEGGPAAAGQVANVAASSGSDGEGVVVDGPAMQVGTQEEAVLGTTDE